MCQLSNEPNTINKYLLIDSIMFGEAYVIEIDIVCKFLFNTLTTVNFKVMLNKVTIYFVTLN